MIFGLYVIYDIVAQEGGNVFTAKNDDVAVRMTLGTLKESTYMNPLEYKLFKVGEYQKEKVEINIDKKEIDFISKLPESKEDLVRKAFDSAQGVKNAK